MNKNERQSRLAQVDRELTRTLEDMRAVHDVLADYPVTDPRSLHADELARYARQLESTRDYLREVSG